MCFLDAGYWLRPWHISHYRVRSCLFYLKNLPQYGFIKNIKKQSLWPSVVWSPKFCSFSLNPFFTSRLPVRSGVKRPTLWHQTLLTHSTPTAHSPIPSWVSSSRPPVRITSSTFTWRLPRACWRWASSEASHWSTRCLPYPRGSTNKC